VAITTPVPRPSCDLSIRPRKPLDDALTSPWVSADSLPYLTGAPDLSSSFRPRFSPTVSPADAHSELGPRSLDPDRPFRGRVCRAYLEPDSAYRLLQLHAFDMRATKPKLFDPRRDGGLDLLPFLSCHAFSLRSGGQLARRATPDSKQPRCRFLPLSRVCPTAMLLRTHHPRGVSPKRLSDDLRARVSGPSEGRVPRAEECSCWLPLRWGACACLVRMRTSFPSLGIQRTSDVTGAAIDKRGAPANEADRPSSPFVRNPAKGADILKNGMPFTVVTSACG
jgi:hypothetical protein